MAELDVTEVLEDPLFTSSVTLIKVRQEADEYGLPHEVDDVSITINAVVTSDSKDLERTPDASQRRGSISVRVSKNVVPDGFQGAYWDAVEWRGLRFAVSSTSDCSQFGAGMLRMICTPQEASDGSYRQP